MKILTPVLLLLWFSTAASAVEPVKKLWDSFYEISKREGFDEPVKIYEVDTEFKTMCFIYKKRVWFFVDGKIKGAVHAKVFNVDGINRISYEPGRSGGAFVLWSNEEIVLSIGS